MSKIISGTLKGIYLDVFPDECMRPTSNRAKEALFDIIQFDIKAKSFIDLFSGTGQIGIEALSRGASKVIFVEKSKKSLNILTKNIKKISSIVDLKSIEIYKNDAFKFLDQFKNKTDFLFSDAPFSMKIDDKMLYKFTKVMSDAGTIIIESPSDRKQIEKFGDFHLIKKYIYGRIKFGFYKKYVEI